MHEKLVGFSHNFAALIPVEDVKALADGHATVSLDSMSVLEQGLPLVRSHWSEDARALETDIIAQYVEGNEDSSGSSDTRSHSDPNPWEVDLADKLSRHGVDEWHAVDLDGDLADATPVKVGIIDWAYTGFDEVPGLPDLDVVDGREDTDGNAFCQPLTESVMPNSSFLYSDDEPCQADLLGDFGAIRHGNNIAELVLDMAPESELSLAQANSPRQVYDAVRWLLLKDVDVIVHAAGWHYDGQGDGVGFFDIDTYVEGPVGGDHHSVWRYYPSPLASVDHAIGEDGTGPVWINAAGNQERFTIRASLDADDVIDTDLSSYHGFVVFEADENAWADQTCLLTPVKWKDINLYSLRWADSEPEGVHELDFEIRRRHVPSWLGRFSYSADVEQYPDNYPVRRTSQFSLTGFDLCVRIRVHPNSDDDIVLPEWIQFQVMGGGLNNEDGPETDLDGTGHSIVNPAESANTGLLAVGALDLAEDEDMLMGFSSHGPVYHPNVDVTRSSPYRGKPDIVSGSYAATWTRYEWDCTPDMVSGRVCFGDDLYFTGTSSATAHTGGMAALVVGWFKDNVGTFKASDVADYMRSAALSRYPSSAWGHGFMKMPCPSQSLGELSTSLTRSGEWKSTDCASESFIDRKSDYYHFEVTSKSKVTVELDSPVQSTQIRVKNGLHHRGWQIGYGTEDSATYDRLDSKVVLPSVGEGHYVVEVTTDSTNRYFGPGGLGDDYTLNLTRGTPVAGTSYEYGEESTAIEVGSTRTLSLTAEGLTIGQAYVVKATSQDDQLGFSSSCSREDSESFTATAVTRQVSFVVYACNNRVLSRDSKRQAIRAPVGSGGILVALHESGSATALHVAQHDVSVSLPELDAPPAPSSVWTLARARTWVRVGWSDVAGADFYRLEYRRVGYSWSTYGSSLSGTSRTVSGLDCETSYDFRVASYGDGDDYAAEWGEPSGYYRVTTSSCLLAPVFYPSSFMFGVDEDAASGAVVGTVTARDPDASDSALRYSITSGNASGRFLIDSVSGVITLAAAVVPTDPEYVDLTVRVVDGDGLADTATVRVRVLKVIPMFSAMEYEFHVLRGALIGDDVGVLVAMDPDASDELLSYSITGGNEAGKFALDSSTGAITVSERWAIDEPTNYTLSVEVLDVDGRTDVATVVILFVKRVRLEMRDYFVTGGEADGSRVVRIEAFVGGIPGRNLVIPLTVENQRGITDADYTGVPETIFIPADEHWGFFDFQVVDDAFQDAGERVKIGFGELPVGVHVRVDHERESHRMVTIRDDDGHSDQVIWSGTMTVGNHGGYLGFSESLTPHVPGSLSANTFSWDGVSGIRVTDLVSNWASGSLGFDVTSGLTGDFENLTLRFDGLALSFADRWIYPSAPAGNSGVRVTWGFLDTEWSVGDQVEVELTYRAR